MIPPIFIINLQRRQDRWDAILHDIVGLKIKNKDLEYKRVDAIDGNDIKTFPKNFGNSYRYACFLSHLKAIEQARISNCPQAIILEDDVRICSDFSERLERALLLLPKDWAIAYLSCWDFNSPSIFNEINDKLTIAQCPSKIMGAFSYMVNQAYYSCVIEKLNKYNNCVDNVYSELQKEIPCYAFHPFFTYVRADFSDNSQMDITPYELRIIKQNYKDYAK